MTLRTRVVLAMLAASLSVDAWAGDAEIVASLDTQYQAAVERSDWQTMDRILHPEFVLVLGDGRVYSRRQLIESTRKRNVIFERQVEVPGTQTVRMFGDATATVTALLIVKGRRQADGTAYDYKLWFTDTYVRTREGWKYALGQASTEIPNTAEPDKSATQRGRRSPRGSSL